MARVKFEDEMATSGELNIDQVRPGDLIRFLAAFEKQGEDDGSETKVDAGEVGEVIEAMADVPGLLVRVPAVRKRGTELVVRPTELFVEPGIVTVVLDSHDPRISTYRTDRTAGFRDLGRVILKALSFANLLDPDEADPTSRVEAIRALEEAQADLEADRLTPVHFGYPDDTPPGLVLQDIRTGLNLLGNTTDEAFLKTLPELIDMGYSAPPRRIEAPPRRLEPRTRSDSEPTDPAIIAPSTDARIPIRTLPSGFVWAEVGMTVQQAKTKTEALIVAKDPPDKLTVDVLDPKTRLPADPVARQTWRAGEVRLSPQNDYVPVVPLTEPEKRALDIGRRRSEWDGAVTVRLA